MGYLGLHADRWSYLEKPRSSLEVGGMRSRNLWVLGKTVAMAALALATLAGCSTPHQSVSVPLPRSTPFDQDPLARMTYLNAFRDGYLAARGAASVPSVETVNRPDRFPYEQGYRAGASAARASQP